MDDEVNGCLSSHDSAWIASQASSHHVKGHLVDRSHSDCVIHHRYFQYSFAGVQLVDLLAEAGPDAVIDIDNALCRESLQVIGAPMHRMWLLCTASSATVLASARWNSCSELVRFANRACNEVHGRRTRIRCACREGCCWCTEWDGVIGALSGVAFSIVL